MLFFSVDLLVSLTSDSYIYILLCWKCVLLFCLCFYCLIAINTHTCFGDVRACVRKPACVCVSVCRSSIFTVGRMCMCSFMIGEMDDQI